MARTGTVLRNTKETQIEVVVNLDGGDVNVKTGIGFFDHMLTAFGFYAKIGLTVQATGDLYVDGHHTVEDVGICLGLALKQALGDRAGHPAVWQLLRAHGRGVDLHGAGLLQPPLSGL